MVMIKIDEKTTNRVIQMYKNDRYTLNEICNLVNISTATIKRIVKKAVLDGIVEPRNKGRSCTTYECIPDEKWEAMAQDYYINNYSTSEMIDKYNIRPAQLQNLRKKYKSIYGNKQIGVHKTKKAPTSEI